MFDVKKFMQDTEGYLKENLKGTGIVACSGGLDSSLLAVLCSLSVNDRVTAVFVDTGLVRKSDVTNIRKFFQCLFD